MWNVLKFLFIYCKVGVDCIGLVLVFYLVVIKNEGEKVVEGQIFFYYGYFLLLFIFEYVMDCIFEVVE